MSGPVVVSVVDKQGRAYDVGITCARCHHHWQPRTPDPKVCPRCHNDWRTVGQGQGRRTDLV